MDEEGNKELFKGQCRTFFRECQINIWPPILVSQCWMICKNIHFCLVPLVQLILPFLTQVKMFSIQPYMPQKILYKHKKISKYHLKYVKNEVKMNLEWKRGNVFCLF